MCVARSKQKERKKKNKKGYFYLGGLDLDTRITNGLGRLFQVYGSDLDFAGYFCNSVGAAVSESELVSKSKVVAV